MSQEQLNSNLFVQQRGKTSYVQVTEHRNQRYEISYKYVLCKYITHFNFTPERTYWHFTSHTDQYSVYDHLHHTRHFARDIDVSTCSAYDSIITLVFTLTF